MNINFSQKNCSALLNEPEANLSLLMQIIIDAGGDYYKWVFNHLKIPAKEFLYQIFSSGKYIFDMSLIVRDENDKVLGCVFYIHADEFMQRSRLFFYMIIGKLGKELTHDFIRINRIFILSNLGKDLNKSDIYISHIGVVDSMRRNGLAGSMIKLLLSRYSKIFLHVNSGNQTAINCYKKMGFYELPDQINNKMILFSSR